MATARGPAPGRPGFPGFAGPWPGQAEVDGAAQLPVAQPEHVGGLGDDCRSPPAVVRARAASAAVSGQARPTSARASSRIGAASCAHRSSRRNAARRPRPQPGGNSAGVVLPAGGRQPLAFVRVMALSPQVELHRFQQRARIVGRHRTGRSPGCRPHGRTGRGGLGTAACHCRHSAGSTPAGGDAGALRARPAPPSVR